MLRDGRMVAEAAAADVDTRWIVEQMTGRPRGYSRSGGDTRVRPGAAARRGAFADLDNGRPLLRDVSLSLRAGEVVGIYGLMGAGRTELLECLMGLHPEMTGSVSPARKRLDPMDTSTADLARAGHGARGPPGLRPGQAFPSGQHDAFSLGRFARGPWLSPAAETPRPPGWRRDLRIKAPGLGHNIESLSGGNQQKVVIAKCLLTGPRVLLLDEPTRGVDVGAKQEIHAIVRQLAAKGMGIVLVSSELEEVRAVASRIVVMSRGAITAEFDAAQAPTMRWRWPPPRKGSGARMTLAPPRTLLRRARRPPRPAPSCSACAR